MKRPVRVLFLQRKPRQFGTFSIEFIFQDIRNRLSEAIRSEVKVSTYPSNGIFKRLYNVLEAALAKADVKHVTGDVHYLVLLLKKRKTVLTIHDCYTLYWNKGAARFFFKIFWFYLPVRCAKYVVAISEATKREIVRFTNCNPEKILVIPTIISSAYQPHPRAFNKSKPVVLHVGLAPNKNFDNLIEAIEGVNCHLSVVGRLTAAHKEKLAHYGISYSYCYNISDEEMRMQYEKCDLLAFVSTYEGFGMPIVEANAVGRPVLTSNLSSMPEVAGDAACLVDPYDVSSIRAGLLKIIRDDAYRASLIEKGYANRRRFNQDKVAGDYENLYLAIANNTVPQYSHNTTSDARNRPRKAEQFI